MYALLLKIIVYGMIKYMVEIASKQLYLTFYCYLDYAVSFIFKKIIGFVDPAKWIGVCDQRFCIDFAVCNQFQCFFTIAAIHSSCFKSKILAIHIR